MGGAKAVALAEEARTAVPEPQAVARAATEVSREAPVAQVASATWAVTAATSPLSRQRC